MTSADQVYNAISKRTDDRGYCRTTLVDLVANTALSMATVRRAIDQLIDDGRIQKRSKKGQAGGLLIRLSNCSPNCSQTAHETAHFEQFHHVVKNQPTSPEGAVGGLVRSPDSNRSTTPGNQSTAYRPTRPHETPESGAELVYTGKQESTQWRRLHATLWQAPNGDAVSVRSMTPELRLRLRVDLNEDGTECLEAIRALKGMLAE